MPPAAQALYQQKLQDFRDEGRFPSLLDFAVARRNALAEAEARPDPRDPYGLNALSREIREEPRPDPELDALLDTLADAIPADEEPAPARPTMPLDWLDAGPDNDNAAPAPLAKIPTKRAARPRRSFARDSRHLNKFNDFVADVRPGKTAGARSPSVGDTLPSPSPTDTTTTTDTPSKTTKKRRKADDSDTRAAPTWDRSTEIIKGHAFARTVSTTGAGISWTLNLGGQVAKAANDNPKGLKERLHDKIAKALRRSPLGAREFFFAPERTPAGRWHLHGVTDATEAELPALEAVLRQVGGEWGSAHHADKQVKLRPVWGLDGWVRYLRKDSAATCRLLGTKTVLSVTRECQRRAKHLWQTAQGQAQDQSAVT